VLFEEAFYCLMDQRDVTDNLNHKGTSMDANSIDSYGRSLKAKVKNAIAIPYDERNKKKM
jgi:hypothetical protein